MLLLLCEQLFSEQGTSLSPTYGQRDLFAAAKLFRKLLHIKNYSGKSFQSCLVKYATLALCLKDHHQKGWVFSWNGL